MKKQVIKSYIKILFFKGLIVLLALFFVLSLQANEKDTSKSKNTLIGLPFAFFSPETGWGGGAGALYAFRFKNEPLSSRPSQVQLGFAYTQKKQLLLYFPFTLYFQNNKYFTYGELGYYIYNFQYFGTGSSSPESAEETFGLKFPRVRISFLKLVAPRLYFGPRFTYDDVSITDQETNGLLDRNTVSGSNGGRISGLGLVVAYDTRDNVFFPSEGNYIELVAQPYHELIGSEFTYTKYIMNFHKYYSLKWKHILAFNSHINHTSGNPPFTDMAMIGGTKKMRGYYQGRYRDRNLALFQTEYRAPLKWKFGLAAFYGVGGVTKNISNFSLNDFKHSYGVGLRYMIDKEKKLNIRLDAGFTEEGSNFYLTFAEAF